MHIKTKTSQHRRDFRAIYQCEHCDAEHEGTGYDDAYFHKTVIPSMVCKQCGLSADDSTPTTSPDVPAHVVI